MRVILETSIARFVRTGLGVYATNLQRAITHIDRQITIIPCAIPEYMGASSQPGVRKVFAAYWQMVHAQIVIPYMARRHHCDIIHYTMTMPVSPHIRCPIVVTLHDIIPFKHPEWLPPLRGHRLRQGIRSAVSRSDHIITDSEATRRDLISYFDVPGDRATAVLLAADLQLPAMSSDIAHSIVNRDFSLEPGYILCVGSIEPRKNIERVVKAFGIIRQRHGIDARLVIVGSRTWQHALLDDAVNSAGLQEAVTFTGHVPAEQLAALFQRAGVFVFPSLYEGFGIPPLEAMQCGCPVVTSSTSSLPEVVGDAAILVDPESTEQIAEAITRILTDTQLADALRQKGRARAALFSWERCARETVHTYRKVLERRTAQR